MRVQIVSFHCVLKNQLGQFISSSFNHEVTTTPSESDSSESQMLPGLVNALKELKSGEKKRINVAAHEAYGLYDEKLVTKILRSEVKSGKKLKTGSQIRGAFVHDGVVRMYRVSDCDSLFVTLDGNHPLAGQDLIFDVEVTESQEVMDSDSEKSPALMFC